MSRMGTDAATCRHCGTVVVLAEWIGEQQWRDLGQRSPWTCFKARNLAHEPESPSAQGEHRPNRCCDFHCHVADGCCHCGVTP